MSTQKLKLICLKIDWIARYLSLFFFLILNTYGKMEHKMLHNAPSLDLSSIILFWKKSRKIDHVSWIDMKLNIPIFKIFLNIFRNSKSYENSK